MRALAQGDLKLGFRPKLCKATAATSCAPLARKACFLRGRRRLGWKGGPIRNMISREVFDSQFDSHSAAQQWTQATTEDDKHFDERRIDNRWTAKETLSRCIRSADRAAVRASKEFEIRLIARQPGEEDDQ